MKISLCQTCGFVFQDPIVDTMVTLDHYVENTRHPFTLTPQIETAKTNQFEWIRSVAESFGFLMMLEKEGRKTGIFEVGASVGALLKEGKNAGWDVAGVEPSREAARVAKETSQIDIQNGSLEEVDHISQPIIAMIHVLEHMPSPVGSLKHIYDITEDYSFLCIEVPDFSYPKYPGFMGFWNVEHINYFSPETLSRCGKQAGWEIVNLYVHNYIEAREYCLYPVIRAAFIKRDRESLIRHRESARDLINGQDYSQAEKFRNKIHRFVQDCGSRVIIFGGGAHTAMLLDIMDKEDRKAIEAVIDSNPQLEGTKMHDHTIDNVKNLIKYKGAGIIVSSQGYQTQMVETIKNTLGNTSPILTFY